MFGWLQKCKVEQEWRLVATLVFTVNWMSSDGGATGLTDKAYYYLYEDANGKRKCQHEGTGDAGGDSPWAVDLRIHTQLYLAKVRPWLDGAFDPGIPSFETIKAKEFKDSLKGQKT